MESAALTDIQQYLHMKGTEEGRVSFQKFIPTSQRVYGVRLPDINLLAKQYKHESMELVIALWQSGSFEERLLAAKLLGKQSRKAPQKTLALIQQFSGDISDWAVCDTLGTQSIKPIAKSCQQEIFALSKQLILCDNTWQRRLGIVLLEVYTKDKEYHSLIITQLEPVINDKAYYVKKAVEWIKRNLSKA